MSLLSILASDLRYSIRTLAAKPALTVVSILTIAVGITLNATLFTILSGLLFRARVDKDPESFIHLSPEYREPSPQAGRPWAISTEDFTAFANNAKSLKELAAWDNVHVTIGDEGEPLLALLVTCNFFSVYGSGRTALGRFFATD
jgi:hypothetical protein